MLLGPHRSTTSVDAAYCYRPSGVVCLSVTLVSPTKTVGPIEIPFVLWSQVGPGNHVLDGSQAPRMGRGDLEGKGESHCKVWRHSVVSCAKTSEPIEMPFRLWARMGPRNHVLDRSPQVLRDVAMATNFGTKIAITGFVRMIATRRLVMEGSLSGRPTECRYCRYLAHRERCHCNHFWLSLYGVHVGATCRI